MVLISLTDKHKNLLTFVDKNEKLFDDTQIINRFDLSTWLDLWREGLVLTNPEGKAYLTSKGRNIVQQFPSEEEPI